MLWTWGMVSVREGILQNNQIIIKTQNTGKESVCLLNACIEFVDLGLEESFQFGPLGFKSWSQEAVLDGEHLRVEVEVFHLRKVEKGGSTDGLMGAEPRCPFPFINISFWRKHSNRPFQYLHTLYVIFHLDEFTRSFYLFKRLESCFPPQFDHVWQNGFLNSL